MNYFKQVSPKELTLFHKYINDLVEGRKSVMSIKCLLYTHDLVLWYEIPKQNAKANTKKDLKDLYSSTYCFVQQHLQFCTVAPTVLYSSTHCFVQ